MGNDQKQYVFVTTDHVCHYLKEKRPFKRLTIRIKIMTSSSFSHTRVFNGLHKKAPLVPVLGLMTPDNCIASQSFTTGFTVNYTAKTMPSKRYKFFSLYD